MILQSIFGPKKDEDGNWRRLHSLYRSCNIVRVIKSRSLKWTRMEEVREVLKIIAGKPVEKKPLGRPRRK